MKSAMSGWGLRGALAVGLLAGLLSGCGSVGESSSEFAKDVIGGGQAPREVSTEAFAGPVYCPPIQLQRNSFLIMKYARGQQDDPAGLLYQATIDDWARSCKADANGQTRIKIGLKGDVTPGPAWKGGEVVLPVRVAILPSKEGAKPRLSELTNVPVTIGEGAPSEVWAIVDDKFLVPSNTEMKIVFGFDEGRRRR